MFFLWTFSAPYFTTTIVTDQHFRFLVKGLRNTFTLGSTTESHVIFAISSLRLILVVETIVPNSFYSPLISLGDRGIASSTIDFVTTLKSINEI